mgnify:CR=1 FL=1
MKKKVLGTMMAFAVLVGSVMPVSASQLHMDGESADVKLSYDNQSTFCINIPEVSISIIQMDILLQQTM